VPVHACVSGEINGPALGVLASCPRRSGYPNATFVLTEPRLHFGGTVTALTAREQQMTRMLDTLYFKLADVTGREVDEIREDARRGRTLTTGQAVGYGLIQGRRQVAGKIAALVWHTPKIALCTHSLSMGNIEPRATPYEPESVRIGTLRHLPEMCLDWGL
jgi:hypothetical protein